jgi:hypothetical protein
MLETTEMLFQSTIRRGFSSVLLVRTPRYARFMFKEFFVVVE